MGELELQKVPNFGGTPLHLKQLECVYHLMLSEQNHPMNRVLFKGPTCQKAGHTLSFEHNQKEDYLIMEHNQALIWSHGCLIGTQPLACK